MNRPTKEIPKLLTQRGLGKARGQGGTGSGWCQTICRTWYKLLKSRVNTSNQTFRGWI